jgi:serine/threonine protein kinase
MSVVAMLITDFDCDLDAVNKEGKDAASVAKEMGHDHISKYLEDAKNFHNNKLRSTLIERLTVTRAIPTGEVIVLGTFSSIIELKIPVTGEKVAGKVFKFDNSKVNTLMPQIENIVKEIEIISCLHHYNVVKIKGVCFLPDRVLPVLLMDIMTSSLHSYVLEHRPPVEKRLNLLHDVASGLAYLHNLSPPFVHGHLTAENVLIGTHFNARIGGFDIKSTLDVFPTGKTDYMPPESEGSSKTPESSVDVFSFGHLSLFCLLQKLIIPILPPTYLDSEGKPHVQHEYERRSQFIKEAGEVLLEKIGLFDAIKQCLHNNPAQRPSATKLIIITTRIL